MSDWRPGFVRAGFSKEVRIEVGQQWLYFPDGDPNPDLRFEVVAHTFLGEVVLRPVDFEAFAKRFPLTEVIFKGKPEMTRVCPFFWISSEHAASNTEMLNKLYAQRENQKDPAKLAALDRRIAENPGYEAEDVAAHEAWAVWTSMVPCATVAAPNPKS